MKELLKMLPVHVHMDGAEMFTNREFDVWSISSPLVNGINIFDAKYQVIKIPAALMKSKAVKKHVMREVACFFAWNFEIMQSGIGPQAGYYGEALTGFRAKYIGKPFMNGYKACFTGWKGDGKARIEAHGFSRNYQCLHMCDGCRATQPFPNALRFARHRSLLYTCMSLGPECAWRDTFIDHETYLAEEPELTSWTVVPGFRKELVVRDIMHVCAQGILRDFCASSLADIIKRGEVILQSSVDGTLRMIWGEFREWCHRRGWQKPYGTLSCTLLGWTQNNEYPSLSTTIKAATVKRFTYFVCEKLIDLENGDEHMRLRATCAWGISTFLQTSDSCGVVLEDATIDALEYAGRLYILSYASLAERAAISGEYLWKVRPKLHVFDHMISDLRETKLNPARYGAWGEEDFLGKIKALTKHCHGLSVLRTSLLRYMLYLGLRWETRRRMNTWYVPT